MNQTSIRTNKKVFDCFAFFNELDVLEIRLETLNPLVDYFVISESPINFNGNPKPLYYNENKERYKKFWPKIIHQVVEDYPTSIGILQNDLSKDFAYNRCVDMCNKADWFPKDYPPYFRDTWSKEILFRAVLQHAQSKNIIMLSDADEIPNPNTLKFILDDFDKNQVYNLNQNWYHYYLNLRKKTDWVGNIILTFEKFMQFGMCELKMKRRGLLVSDGGWHFSYVGDFNKIMEKLDSGQEHTWDVKLFKDNLKQSIDNALTCGHDLHFWPSEFEVANINTMPQYVVDNQDKFKDLLK